MRGGWLPGLAFVLALAGCGSDRADEGLLARQIGASLRGGAMIFGPRADVPDIPPALTPAVLAGIGAPVMVARVGPPDQVAGFLPVAANGQVLTWSTQSGSVTLSFTGGTLTATRGLGDDLLSVDTEELRARLASGEEGLTVRVHRYLDGENQVRAVAFRCRVADAGPDAAELPFETRPARLFIERCTGVERSFENRYWRSDGIVVRSEQWVGPGERRILTRIAFPPEGAP